MEEVLEKESCTCAEGAECTCGDNCTCGENCSCQSEIDKEKEHMFGVFEDGSFDEPNRRKTEYFNCSCQV